MARPIKRITTRTGHMSKNEIDAEYIGIIPKDFNERFILASGSLKEIAKQYNVTYPTVRLRLDRLIQKIQIS